MVEGVFGGGLPHLSGSRTVCMITLIVATIFISVLAVKLTILRESDQFILLPWCCLLSTGIGLSPHKGLVLLTGACQLTGYPGCVQLQGISLRCLSPCLRWRSCCDDSNFEWRPAHPLLA